MLLIKNKMYYYFIKLFINIFYLFKINKKNFNIFIVNN